MKERIAILMATYNGALYIGDQLDSIIRQTVDGWQLYIQDDVSTDDTIDIIRQYAAKDTRIHLRVNESRSGAAKNFMTLLSETDADYYMFCDQDDYWLSDKIEISLKKMKELESSSPDTPVIVHTDLTVVDASLNVMNQSFWHISRIDPSILNSFNWLGAHYPTTGCTMMINGIAKQVSLPIKKDTGLLHDAWVTVCVFKHHGIVYPIYKTTILYRQHSNNTLGASDVTNHYVLSKIKGFRTVIRKNAEAYRMLHAVGYGSFAKILFYKIMYFIKLNIKSR